MVTERLGLLGGRWGAIGWYTVKMLIKL